MRVLSFIVRFAGAGWKRPVAVAGSVVLLASGASLRSASGRNGTAATSADRLPASGTEDGQPLVEFEMMTWPEVKRALESGKTTALIYTGGTEQRGPQCVNGGHNLMARATVKAIALKLGNAIAMPVLPYTPNNATPELPGTLGLTNELLAGILERISEESIKNGFRTVILMGDHGGGQSEDGNQPNVYKEVAKKLDERYAPQGIHVYYCNEVYHKAQADFDKYLESKEYPRSSHAGIPDTSEMLYLGGDAGWVRKELIKSAVGDPPRSPSQAAGSDPARGQRSQQGRATDPNAQPRINNGIRGDARPSTAELGKLAFDMKVDYAVRQIRRLVGTK